MRLFQLGEKKTNYPFVYDVTCEACLKFLSVLHRFAAILPKRKKGTLYSVNEAFSV